METRAKPREHASARPSNLTMLPVPCLVYQKSRCAFCPGVRGAFAHFVSSRACVWLRGNERLRVKGRGTRKNATRRREPAGGACSDSPPLFNWSSQTYQEEAFVTQQQRLGG